MHCNVATRHVPRSQKKIPDPKRSFDKITTRIPDPRRSFDKITSRIPDPSRSFDKITSRIPDPKRSGIYFLKKIPDPRGSFDKIYKWIPGPRRSGIQIFRIQSPDLFWGSWPHVCQLPTNLLEVCRGHMTLQVPVLLWLQGHGQWACPKKKLQNDACGFVARVCGYLLAGYFQI